jgi:hypothetical protein
MAPGARPLPILKKLILSYPIIKKTAMRIIHSWFFYLEGFISDKKPLEGVFYPPI